MDSNLLPLDQPRVVTFKDRGHVYTYTFKRISSDDWRKYFNAAHVSSENTKDGRESVIDFATAGADLVRRTVDKVEGYAGNFTARENWRELLPPSHLSATFGLLIATAPDAARADEGIDPLGMTVRLKSTWTSREAGKMTQFDGLIHLFNVPTLEQQMKYNRALNRQVVVGGSRSGQTLYPHIEPLLIEFYDALIQGVFGYQAGDHQLSADLVEIRKEMDAHHKYVAARELFVDQTEAE
jgi:hypothetical protein